MASITQQRATRALSGHATDLFVSHVNHIEIIGGGMVRVTFLVNRNDGNGGLEAEPADWALVLPLEAVPDGIGKAIAVTARAVLVRGDGSVVLRQ